ncbi:MAG: cell division protein FtsQ [Acidobacteria bacterium]|nr:cell division protein FtsQ [Acidobacteriota bacterium]
MAVSVPTDKRFRRARVPSGRNRGRFDLSRKRVVYAAVLGGLVMYLGYRAAEFIMTAEALRVTRITVTGSTRLSRSEVQSLLEGLNGSHMLLVSLEEWRRKVLASPWVEDAAIRRVLPGTIDVVIAERQPMGIGRIDKALYLLDQRGGIIDEFGPDHAEFDLPLIDGLAAAERAGAGEPAVDEGRAALAMRLLTSLKGRPDLAGRVSQIDVTDIRDAVVILKGDTALIRLGDDQFAERLQSYLDVASALREKVPQIDYVDLRFGERVYVRPQGARPRRQHIAGGG